MITKEEIKTKIINLVESIKDKQIKDEDESDEFDIPYSFWISWIKEILNEINWKGVGFCNGECTGFYWDFRYEIMLTNLNITISITWEVYNWKWLTIKWQIIER